VPENSDDGIGMDDKKRRKPIRLDSDASSRADPAEIRSRSIAYKPSQKWLKVESAASRLEKAHREDGRTRGQREGLVIGSEIRLRPMKIGTPGLQPPTDAGFGPWLTSTW
jgi:hypothetical protein